MGIESGVGYIDDLVVTNPESTDVIAEGDDHIRLTKQAVKGSFTSLGREAVIKTAAQINNLVEGGSVKALLNTKILNIGSWNMNTSPTVSISHGLTLSKIRTITVLIRDDLNVGVYDLSSGGQGLAVSSIVIKSDATSAILIRGSGGFFDNTSFDIMGDDGNRGWIVIQYID